MLKFLIIRWSDNLRLKAKTRTCLQSNVNFFVEYEHPSLRFGTLFLLNKVSSPSHTNNFNCVQYSKISGQTNRPLLILLLCSY